MKRYRLLRTIDFPSDLRRLNRRELPQLSQELRAFLLDSLSRTGGHLSSNLGVVELTVALHYVFDTPDDRIVWDVGHQAYPHKILTGRRERMRTLRQSGGISGFPVRSESPYDAFGTAHSSTSISAALGMAVAAKLQKVKRHAIAVIGDGAMSAGMAFEAMNNVGVAQSMPFIVVLNDNGMSISPPVGALSASLSRLTSGRGIARRSTEAEHTTRPNLPDTLFGEFGFHYVGPIDGHDLDALITVLEAIKQQPGPHFLHVVTKKEQGYFFAEHDPVLYHQIKGPFSLEEGITPSAATAKKTWSQVFGEWLCDVAELDSRVVGITPAMGEGSGMVRFAEAFPERYFDVGIGEQHAVTFAAGLAADGLKPVVAIYSTFLQRAYDQLIHDVALQNLPVVFAIDRAGVVGADGATHLGSYDIAFLRCIPNMIVMAASNENECRQMFYTALQQASPTAVRYPRGTGTGVETVKPMSAIPIGKGEILRHVSQTSKMRIAILAFGAMVAPALGAASLLDATLANMRFIKPLDSNLIYRLATTHDAIVTVEEGCVMGGAGSACAEALSALCVNLPILHLGLPDHLIDHGDPLTLLADCGLDTQGIATAIRTRFQLPLPETQ
ncbi:1-deoxy-D-xylulose-5-phosphate synthase [Phytobacter diazotrophicus]|uniref:1-deoxy-D-xylulose-5-phosphate synthase n=1 Tax=Phytobacter diazotrophicus TaxID=395631 RepID=UPI00232BC41F|nr:1-deoxy-D-xylulose-5-phosphate synthase [Phytobacter diazotrophicus]MDC0726187.1 1-deoxy-D-xylulose-5-phosphate synthase [Phytobacter diazotrophicus]MDC0733551.1 1-deoxy-D-xylulose-5-phosphate synthase [Phytobacter diazotrophicus]